MSGPKDTTDGGPAFPQPGTKFEDGDKVARSWDDPGMTLRDYFAAKALTGIIASFTGQDTPLPATGMAATTSYDYADAMLKERAK